MDLTNLTLAGQAALLRSGQCSSREIGKAYQDETGFNALRPDVAGFGA